MTRFAQRDTVCSAARASGEEFFHCRFDAYHLVRAKFLIGRQVHNAPVYLRSYGWHGRLVEEPLPHERLVR